MTKLEGILPVLKPAGWTSHDVVAKVRRITREKRIGHTGTLDPDVTGVLPLCIGRATRLVEYIQELPKQYEAELTVGYATTTEDASGEVIARAGHVQLEEEQVRKVLQAFTGDIEQIPPMYSAVKFEGKRLYELARQGKEVERKPRQVRIESIELLMFEESAPYPRIRFRVTCSKGTYIRTLCVDIGKALGYPAVMSGLVRTATGLIPLAECLSLPDIERLMASGGLAERLIAGDRAVAHLPAVHAGEAETAHALQGKTVRPDDLGDLPDGQLVRLYGASQRFLGIFRVAAANRTVVPEKVFL